MGGGAFLGEGHRFDTIPVFLDIPGDCAFLKRVLAGVLLTGQTVKRSGIVAVEIGKEVEGCELAGDLVIASDELVSQGHLACPGSCRVATR